MDSTPKESIADHQMGFRVNRESVCVCNSQASCLGFKRRLEDTWTGLETTTNLTEHIFSNVFCLLFFIFIEPWSYHCLLLIVLYIALKLGHN